jgi:predicted DNA-binding protein (UPF0251 family)
MSPRQKKPRQCGCAARAGATLIYKPAGIPLAELEQVRIERDELESLYLCDLQGMTQEEAGTCLGVSRGTVQRMITAGRRKVIEAITANKALIILPSPDASSLSKGES